MARSRIPAWRLALAASVCCFIVFRHYVRAPSFQSLPRPLLSKTDAVGQNCTSTVAADRDGDIWEESGCEAHSSGIRRQYRLLAPRRAQLRVVIERLRQLPEAPDPPACPDGFVVEFNLEEADGTDRSWDLCSHQEPWPEPFESALRAMAVEPTFLDHLDFLH